jgi:microcin C transport system substrate-binding protein
VNRILSQISRRRLIALGSFMLAAPACGSRILAAHAASENEKPVVPAGGAREIETHGISIFGDLKYPADFAHFEYVEPNAPKGGLFSHIGGARQFNENFLTFNSLNSFILKGDGAQGMELTFATLMASAEDEPDAMYGLAAQTVRISPDGLIYRFLMRPEARFHDGSRLTAQDVAFSINLLKDKGHPIIHQLMRDVLGAEAEGNDMVVVRFVENRARDIPLLVAALPIFSRAYYTSHEFDQTTLETPLGSGPYKVGRFEPGRYIEYERVADWWGAALPVNVGQYNFDVVRYEFYRDRDVAFEGFTAKNYLFREEFTSRTWATRYDFPGVRDGRVKQEVIPDDTPSGGQGWFFNTRRPKFADLRLREALNYAFDFEWTNKTIMYGAYKRTHSYFQNSDMMAVGPPSSEELALLEPWRGRVPDTVFGEPFVPPVSNGSGQDRALLRKASQMLQDAGFPIRGGKRVNAKGEPISFEFLIDDQTFEPHHMPFIKNLATLGIDATLRVVDPVQYRARVDDFDFDVTVERFNFSTTPGDSLRAYFSSQAADTKGSFNLAAIANPAIDALIDRVIAANTRPELVIACRALDRVIRAGFYWIPQWYNPTHRLAYWDVFDHPKTHPRYPRGLPEMWESIWWYDRDKAARMQRTG